MRFTADFPNVPVLIDLNRTKALITNLVASSIYESFSDNVVDVKIVPKHGFCCEMRVYEV